MTRPAVKPEAAEAIRWRIDVPLVTHPLMMAIYLKAFLVTGLIMAAFLAFLAAVSTGRHSILPMLGLTAAVTATVFVLGLVGTFLLLRNRMAMEFVVDDAGVRQSVVDRRARRVQTAATVLGALSGRPGVAGAGILAAPQNERTASWRGIVSVRFHPRWNAVSLRNAWRTVMIVFCTPANYDAVVARIEAATARGESRGARRNPVPALLAWTVGIVLACLPFFTLAYPFEIDLFAPIFTLCFALTALWLIPIFGWVVIGGVGWMAYLIAAAASVERRSSISGEIYRVGSLLDGDDIAHLVLAGTGAIFLVGLAAGLLTGRVKSGLFDDEAELEIE